MAPTKRNDRGVVFFKGRDPFSKPQDDPSILFSKGEFNFAPVKRSLRRRSYERKVNSAKIDIAKSFQCLTKVIFLDGQLLVVCEILEGAAATGPEVGTEGLDPER